MQDLQVQIDGRRSQFRFHQIMNGLENTLGRHRDQLRLRGPGELQEILYDSVQAVNFLADDAGVLVTAKLRRQGFLEAEEPELDRGEWVADFVGDSCPQGAK